jgi:hypothetical protein
MQMYYHSLSNEGFIFWKPKTFNTVKYLFFAEKDSWISNIYTPGWGETTNESMGHTDRSHNLSLLLK